MRLDRYLAQMSIGTRSEVKRFIKSGRVFVNGVRAVDCGQKIATGDDVMFDGESVAWEPFEYYMLNKPQGTVSSTKDRDCRTVVSLITTSSRDDLFPVGRLDKDTEGLLLVTNDGALAHELLAPGKHVWKRYLVRAEGILSEDDIAQLQHGVSIGDDKPTLPARVDLREDTTGGEEEASTWLELSIREGRYHQIKRMLAAVGHPVLYLKRLSMGRLQLDEYLRPGEYRRLTEEEIALLKGQ